MEKGRDNQQQIERFNLAKAEGVCYEWIFIHYTLMENRLTSIVLHAGVTNKTRLKLATNPKVRPELEQIFQFDTQAQPQLIHINTKINLMRQILAWAKIFTADKTNELSPEILWVKIARLQWLEEMLELLISIDIWREVRNERYMLC